MADELSDEAKDKITRIYRNWTWSTFTQGLVVIACVLLADFAHRHELESVSWLLFAFVPLAYVGYRGLALFFVCARAICIAAEDRST